MPTIINTYTCLYFTDEPCNTLFERIDIIYDLTVEHIWSLRCKSGGEMLKNAGGGSGCDICAVANT